MFELFSKNQEVSICVETEQGCVWLAAQDLAKNLDRLSNSTGKFPVLASAEGRAIYIAEAKDGTYRGVEVPQNAEGYAVSIREGEIVIVGYDALGAMYGIYSFCEKILGISPMYRFTGLFPEVRAQMEIEPASYVSQKPAVKFRGWFMNDEDLLTDFKQGGGNRNIDYPFYAHVMHPDVLDMVLETALRCGINLVIPSSFVDIANPDEERLVQGVCRRGLYISQHHVEPMGVSYFGADNYIKARGIDAEVSFVKHPELMEEIWRYYAQKWAAYADHVVWQFGLRGKADEAVWKSDKNVPMDGASRGKIISDAIALQNKIVAETLGREDFEATATLWLEGAELYDKGYLVLPKNIVAVFCDIGYNQMFGDDFYHVTRRPDQKYGVYYHVGFWGRGPHLAEACAPEKMIYSYREAERMQSLYYSILNVSNIRPLHFSALMNAKLMENVHGFETDAYMERFYTEIYGSLGTKVAEGMRQYYHCFADFGEEYLKELCDRPGFHYHKYENLPFMNLAATDGLLRFCGTEVTPDMYEQLKQSEQKFAKLYQYWQELAPEIPDRAKEYFESYQLFQPRYMLLMIRMCMAAADIERGKDVQTCALAAVTALEEILEARKVLEQGEWKDWHHGETKINIKKMLADYRAMLGK